MKKSILLFVFLLTTTFGFSQEIKPQMNEYLELVGTIARLADFQEYNMKYNNCDFGGLYTAHIDSAFSKFKDHKIIKLFKSYASDYGIGYDAVASIGLNLFLNDKGFTLDSVNKDLIESRWADVDKKEFLTELTDFYHKSDYHKFYLSQQYLFDRMIETYSTQIMPNFNQDWFTNFFGKELNENFIVLIGGNNGGSNYGGKRGINSKKNDIYSVMMFAMDSVGTPLFSHTESERANVHLIMIHEFCHSFVNPLLEENTENYQNLKSSGEALYKLTEYNMRRMAYPQWNLVMNESVVRALEIIYAKEQNYSENIVKNKLLSHIQIGFFWLPELVQCIEKYNHNRDEYPTFSEYYPEIIKFYDEYTAKYKANIQKAIE